MQNRGTHAFMENAMTAQHAAHYIPLGSIESATPAAALIAALQALRPQWNLRLVAIESDDVPRYRVEIEHDVVQIEGGHIGAWLRIKGALMATFPADKPNAVMAIDP